MSALFEGLGTLTAAALGGSVNVTPLDGTPRDVVAIFRERPEVIFVEGGAEVPTVIPTLRGPRDVIGDLVAGSTVRPGDGREFEVKASIRTQSPAPDGHIILQLELTDAPS